MNLPVTSKTNFRSDINALRALAVSTVVLYHFRVPGFGGGFLGVDIFFVISGYLMTKIIVTDLLQEKFKYFAFIAMRVARIWPALLFLAAILLLLGYFFLPPLDYLALANQVRAASLFFSNEEFKQGIGYFSSGPDERWLLHTWSLSVEWQFYLVFPLVLVTANRLIGARWKNNPTLLSRYFLNVIVVLFFISFSYNLWATKTDQTSAFFSLAPRIWEMLAGGIVYLVKSKPGGTIKSKLSVFENTQNFAFLGLLGITAIAGIGDWEKKWPGAWALLPVLLTMMALATKANGGICQRIVDSSIIQRIGLWSYSIYLWHWPVVVALNFSELHPPLAAYWAYLRVAGIALSVLFGWLSYRLVEQSFQYSKGLPIFQRGVLSAVGGAAMVIAFSVLVIHSSGWLARTGSDGGLYKELAKLKTDPVIPEFCQNSGASQEVLESCSLHAEKPGPKVLVIGDSHAQHLYSWFQVNSQAPVDFFTSSGCPPVHGFNRVGARFHCDRYTSEALTRAAQQKYSTVVIAGNWSGVRGLCHMENGQCAQGLSDAKKHELMVASNHGAWLHLAHAGKKVLVIDQSPISRFNVLTTAMRRRFLNMEPLTTFIDTQANGPGKQYLDQIFEKFPPQLNLHRVPLRDELCSGAVCKMSDNESELPPLIDRDHFSSWWITRNGKTLEQQLHLKP